MVAVSFIGGGNRRTLRKPPTCRKSLTNFITFEAGSNINKYIYIPLFYLLLLSDRNTLLMVFGWPTNSQQPEINNYVLSWHT